MSSDSDRTPRTLWRIAWGSALAVVVMLAVASFERTSAPAAATHLAVAGTDLQAAAADASTLRVCADPNNLPFSNDRQEGFENAIATLTARALGRRLEYHWQPQRRGFVRTALNAGWCDAILGVPAGYDPVATTQAYYRSTYVFVSRRGAAAPVRSFDDPRLRTMSIGVELAGDDGGNPPAVQALVSRRLVDRMRPYLIYGDYSTPDPPRSVIDAVAGGDVTTAVAWGPLAGYFARQSRVPLAIEAVTPSNDGHDASFTFAIAMGVRRSDHALRDALDGVIARERPAITRVLASYGVPLLPLKGVS